MSTTFLLVMYMASVIAPIIIIDWLGIDGGFKKFFVYFVFCYAMMTASTNIYNRHTTKVNVEQTTKIEKK